MAKTVRSGRKRSSLKKQRGLIGKKSKVARRNMSRRRVKLMRGGGGGKHILLIIDPQNDFTPGSYIDTKGGMGPSLSVPNADVDLIRLAKFLENTTMIFDEVHVSLDSHNMTHIAHLGFWDLNQEQLNEINGNFGIVGFRLNPKPSATTDIVAELDNDLNSIKIELYNLGGRITLPGCDNIMPRGFVTIDRVETHIDKSILKKLAVDYINKLTLSNTNNPSKPLPNTWPAHCIIGTKGWEIYEPLANVLNSDKYKHKVFIHEKGTNDLVEMYSIFKAEVPYPSLNPTNKISNYHEGVPLPNTSVNVPNSYRNYATGLNLNFIERLRGKNNENTVYVCGEAKTHCVKTSAEDLVGVDGTNVVMLYNAMSDIMFPPIFIGPRKKVFGELKTKNVKFATIDDETNTIIINEEYDPENDNYGDEPQLPVTPNVPKLVAQT